MSVNDRARESAEHQEMNGRRAELRALLLSAASAARQSRRMQAVSDRLSRSLVRPIRERVSTLLSAAG
jgi:hypothetical protein